MCVSVGRSFRAVGAPATRAGAFAGAAMLNTLGPADWQISADVESAVEHRVRTVFARAAHATVHVELTVHCDHVDVAVSSTDPDAAGERVQLRPRRPFAGTVECLLPAES